VPPVEETTYVAPAVADAVQEITAEFEVIELAVRFVGG
jgi:hypothetical protein